MGHLGLWFSSEHSSGVGLTDGLDNPRILFQPNHLYNLSVALERSEIAIKNPHIHT